MVSRRFWSVSLMRSCRTLPRQELSFHAGERIRCACGSAVARKRPFPKSLMRSILIRFAVPTLIAVSILAFFGVPYVDRILAEWFRSDVDMRAQLVAHSMEGSLTSLLERDDKRGLRGYLAGI